VQRDIFDACFCPGLPLYQADLRGARPWHDGCHVLRDYTRDHPNMQSLTREHLGWRSRPGILGKHASNAGVRLLIRLLYHGMQE
jgi:hypothetical protein